MTAPATPPPGGTEYRPGLPSVEDVRAHEERGKRWHRRHRDGTYPADIVSLYIHAREGTIWEHDGGGARPAVADTLFEYRPCLPDGTPCPWPGDAPAAQQAPALTPAEQELRTEAEHGIWEDNHLEDCRRRMPAPAPAQPAQLTEEERRAMRQQANDWGAVAAEARGGGNGAKANVAEQNRAVLLAIIDRLAPKEQP